MKKEDYIWAAIKIFGLYLMVKAIIVLPHVGGGLYLLVSTDVFEHIPDKENPKNMYDMAYYAHQKQVVLALLEFVLYSIFSTYFLKGGKFIFNLMNKKDN